MHTPVLRHCGVVTECRNPANVQRSRGRSLALRRFAGQDAWLTGFRSPPLRVSVTNSGGAEREGQRPVAPNEGGFRWDRR
jgi:hypothetical protein